MTGGGGRLVVMKMVLWPVVVKMVLEIILTTMMLIDLITG